MKNSWKRIAGLLAAALISGCRSDAEHAIAEYREFRKFQEDKKRNV